MSRRPRFRSATKAHPSSAASIPACSERRLGATCRFEGDGVLKIRSLNRSPTFRSPCTNMCRKPNANTHNHPLVHISDIILSKLHMTVPRVSPEQSIPEILVLHRAHLDTSEVQEMRWIRVTLALRIIDDLLRSGHLDRSQLKLAVDDHIRRGLIGRREIDRIPDDKLQRSCRELCGQPAMDGAKSYKTAGAFRAALETRLQRRASKTLTCSASAGKRRSNASWHECFRGGRR